MDATGLEGRGLSNHSGKLEILARQAGLRPLMSFFSAQKGEVQDLLGVDRQGLQIPDEQWFSATEGLDTIRALLARLSDSPPEHRVLAQELKKFEKVLESARAKNVRWHLGIDL